MRYFRKSWLLTAGAALLVSSCGGARALVNVDVIGDAPFSSGSTLVLSDGTAVSRTFPDVIIDSVTPFHAGLYLPSGVSGVVTITATMEMAACVTGRGQVTIPGVAAGQSNPTVGLLVSHVTCQPLPTGTGGAGAAGGHGGVGGPSGTGGVTQGAGGSGQGTGGASGLGGGPGSGGSSGDGGSPGAGGGPGVGGAPGTGGSGVGGAVMGTGGAPAVTCASDPALIDNMESGTGNICASSGRSGYWFSYVDASSTLSPTTVPTPPTVLPAPRGASLRAVHISGTLAAGGSSHYAGVGCFLDTVPTTYNATAHAYSGIQFYAMGTASAPTLIVQNTTTEAVVYGGTCSLAPATNCAGNSAPITGLTPNQWISVSIPFSAISGGSAAFNPQDIWSIEFQPGAGAYDLWIDDLSFY